MSRNHFNASHVDEKGAMVNNKTIKIGGAAGFWGETDMAMSQFFAEGDLDYIVFDSLAEITMSILARARVLHPPATTDEIAVFEEHTIPDVDPGLGTLIAAPLQTIAWGRSGDKGDKANIGIIARKAEHFPWIATKLTADCVGDRFSHFMTSPDIDRYYMPGLPALNFLLQNALGGGGIASLRNDPQAKAYAQVLLDTPIMIPQQLLEA